MSNYKVHRGDTLTSIAARHHMSLGKLEKANRQIHNPNSIYVGETVHIPGHASHHKDTFEHGHKSKHPAHHASSKHPVKRLNQDLKHLHTAKVHENHAKAHEKHAEKALKHDRSAEKTALGKIADRKDALEAQILQAEQPTTPGGTPGTPPASLLNQVVQLGRKEVQTKDHFAHEIASDKKTLKADRKTVAKDAKAYKKDLHQGRKDLKPAEYHLSLKKTNHDRKLLGLKALKHAVRPKIHNTVGGKVGKWIAQAQQVLAAHGVSMGKMNAHDIDIIIQHESSGNPKAVNRWDSNAAAGHPSEGLMQTIGPTFNAYKLPGHGHILNPVDNIIAGVRYAISRYGSISNVPGVRAVHAGRAYVGY